MKKKLKFTIVVIVLIIGSFGVMWGVTDYYFELPNRVSQQETIVLGQNRWVPGSTAALRVVTRDRKDATPLANAEIRVSLKPDNGSETIMVYSGVTDNRGGSDVVFNVPTDIGIDHTLVVQTTSELGSDTIEQPISIDRDYKILLTTDKPIYQPGQEIHMRALALSTFDLVPNRGKEIEFIITDGKGNKVYRKSFETSDWGVVAADFRLASEVNTGTYKILASLGNTISEKTITVENYILPKFKISFDTDKDFYLPGETVSGSLISDYFFGKPVAGGEVVIDGYLFDVERIVIVNLHGQTDEDGIYQFEFELPDFIAATELENGLGRFYMQAFVTDLTSHTETANLSLNVSMDTLMIDAIPEGGLFKPGVENILYVFTSYPDGSPAETHLELEFYNTGEIIHLETGVFGLAQVAYTPNEPWQDFSIVAKDKQGNTSTREFNIDGVWEEETVLLRPGKPFYTVGETMNLGILTSSSSGTVYLDIVREGQTISTKAVDIVGEIAHLAVDLSPDMYGTLELHAYKILSSGHTTRDTRLVVVDNANDLSLTIAAQYPFESDLELSDNPYYLPGETASVDISIQDQVGTGVPAAIGLAVVDESVFSLAEQDPGFAKLYFLLEGELLKPKYDLHGFSLPDLVRGIPESDDELLGAIENAAQASLAEVSSQRSSFTLDANSHDETLILVRERQNEFFTIFSLGLFFVCIIISLIYIVLAIFALHQKRVLGRSILTSILVFVLPILLISLWPHPWAKSFNDKLILMLDWLAWNGDYLVLTSLILGLVGVIASIIVAFRRKDSLLGWKLGLIPVTFGILIFVILALSEINSSPAPSFFIIGIIGLMMIPMAFLFRSFGYFWLKDIFSGIAVFPVAFIFFVGFFGLNFSRAWGIPFAAQNNFNVMKVGEIEELRGLQMALPIDGSAVADEFLMEVEVDTGSDDGSVMSGTEPPRIRQFFPETMLWLPEMTTDATGKLNLEFPVADSITNWRMTALASSQDGRLGSSTAPLRVFQDFFVDIDLPLSLTEGDEVSVPVGIFNYLEAPQIVRLELQPEEWFDLLGDSQIEIEIGAEDITVVYFRIRATKFGRQPFRVTAWGSKMSDAIQKDVQVYPDGKQIYFTNSDRFKDPQDGSLVEVREVIPIPEDAIPGTQKVAVKIYPGMVSQVVEGLDTILRMPYGCFEQTSSTTYPNVLVLDYLKFTDQVAPELQFKAEEYINLGYQRLTTFEVAGSGGFSLFGDSPPDRMLTAYGLQEFSDMSRVWNVDPALVNRAAEWLFIQQDSNGSWENDRGLVHESTWSNLGDDRLPITAYIVWSLADAGFGDDVRTQNGLSYIKEFNPGSDDPYVVALTANAMVAFDINNGAQITDETLAVLDRLDSLAIKDGNSVVWQSEVATFMGSEGQASSIETTALAALAFLRANRSLETANAAITTLIQNKDSFGTWYSTQSTVLVLKALIQSVKAGSDTINAKITIRLNDGQTRFVNINSENYDVVQLLTFDDINLGRDNIVDISVEGEGNLMYQVTGSYYLPWENLDKYPQLVGGSQLMSIDLAYDRTELTVDDTVGVNVIVDLSEGQAESALIDLGVPPGFSVETQDLAAIVAYFDDIPVDYAFPTIERFELTGRQILIYVSNLTSGNPLEFSYRLRAKFPLIAQTPSSSAYDYYNPEVNAEVAPQLLTVGGE